MDFSFFLPGEISQPIALALLAISFIASMITAALSLGGGILMMSVLTVFFPPAVLLPFFGAIQSGSNFGRAWVQRAHIQWQIAVWFCLGAAIGSFVGVQFATMLPEQIFKIIIAVFILVMTWMPQPKIQGRGNLANFSAGGILAFLGMIVGVIGPLVMTFIRYIPDRRQLVGTHAAIMSVFNLARLLAFIAVGFAFWAYLPLAAAMIFTGFLGTLMGSMLLNRLPEQTFRWVLKFVITGLALNLLYRAF